MNFKKTFAGIVAASVAAISVSVSAGATGLAVRGACTDASGMDLVMPTESMWLAMAYNNGERNANLADKNKAIVDYGIDWSTAGSIEVIFHVSEDTIEDWIDEENDLGGGIVLSSNADGDSSHNWPRKEFWGVDDDSLEFTSSDAHELHIKAIGDYQYKVVCPIDDTNSVVPNAQMVQIGFCVDNPNSKWWEVVLDSMTVKDTSGNDIISWDGATGQATLGGGAAVSTTTTTTTSTDTAAEVETSTPTVVPGANITIENNEITFTRDDLQGVETLVITYSAEEDAAVSVGACAATNDWAWTELGLTLPAGENQTYEVKMSDVYAMLGASDASELGDATKIYNAGGNAEFIKAEVKVAGQVGNVAAATDSSKGSPNTGVADVAAVAGLAVVAAGAVVVAKKRK